MLALALFLPPAPSEAGDVLSAECRERGEMTLDVTASEGFGCVRGVFVVTLS